jgi:uncharacterized protein
MANDSVQKTMDAENNSLQHPPEAAAPPSESPAPPAASESAPALASTHLQMRDKPAVPAIHKVFVGPYGLRSGWRVLMYYVMVFGPLLLLQSLLHGSAGEMFKPGNMLISELIAAALALAAAVVMSRIEGRSFGDYGLALRTGFFMRLLEGVVWGFAAESAIMGILYATGNLTFGGVAEHGLRALGYAIVWGLAFFLVGVFEEFTFRGYPQFTLAARMGFWPAAFLLSGLFWLAHMGNPGETWIGGLATALVALAFCVALRRTGNLWFPIGMHAAFDWAETYLFGVPDSGNPAQGYLLNTTLHGSKWMTGGTVGPEGSVVTLLVVLLVGALLFWRFPTVRYLPSGAPRRPEASDDLAQPNENPSQLRA